MSAFKDFTPGQGGGSAAPAAAASDEPAEEPAEEEEGGDEEAAESSGGGGDYPPHSVMGLPALSPTMSQGAASLTATHSLCSNNYHHYYDTLNILGRELRL